MKEELKFIGKMAVYVITTFYMWVFAIMYSHMALAEGLYDHNLVFFAVIGFWLFVLWFEHELFNPKEVRKDQRC